eukprot:m.311825 g.311825  ORF g.311825 m.311825 type:complete len:58 (-) comp15961_c6_seq1:2136-2309(-)
MGTEQSEGVQTNRGNQKKTHTEKAKLKLETREKATVQQKQQCTSKQRRTWANEPDRL